MVEEFGRLTDTVREVARYVNKVVMRKFLAGFSVNPVLRSMRLSQRYGDVFDGVSEPFENAYDWFLVNIFSKFLSDEDLEKVQNFIADSVFIEEDKRRKKYVELLEKIGFEWDSGYNQYKILRVIDYCLRNPHLVAFRLFLEK